MSISIAFWGTFWIMIYWKNARLDHMKTALLFMCEVARNSPDGEKLKEGRF